MKDTLIKAMRIPEESPLLKDKDWEGNPLQYELYYCPYDREYVIVDKDDHCWCDYCTAEHHYGDPYNIYLDRERGMRIFNGMSDQEKEELKWKCIRKEEEWQTKRDKLMGRSSR